MSSQYQTFGKLSWGLTACDGPNGYSGLYGAAPNGGETTDDAAIKEFDRLALISQDIIRHLIINKED